jgi:hypothetical protein
LEFAEIAISGDGTDGGGAINSADTAFLGRNIVDSLSFDLPHAASTSATQQTRAVRRIVPSPLEKAFRSAHLVDSMAGRDAPSLILAANSVG